MVTWQQQVHVSNQATQQNGNTREGQGMQSIVSARRHGWFGDVLPQKAQSPVATVNAQ